MDVSSGARWASEWDGAKGAVSLILPACNEAENLPQILERAGRVLRSMGRCYEILIVGDGSADGTGSIAAAAAAASSFRVRVIRHSENRGLGDALRTGLLAALPSSQAVVTMDADDTHDPALIPRLVARLDAGSDFVIASRFAPGGAEVGVSLSRRLLSRAASIVLRRVAPLNGVRDYSSGYRAYSADLLQRLVKEYGEDALVSQSGFACMIELLLKTRRLGAKIAEVPLVLRYDLKRGPSKLRILPTIRAYASVLRTHRNSATASTSRPSRVSWTRSDRIIRALNIAVAGIGLALNAPLLLVIAVLVKLTSSGPVFYSQVRVGIDRRNGQQRIENCSRRADYGGRLFTIYKFRTMYCNQRSQQQVWASPDDPRVTRIGRILRKTRLDELPQFLNVLLGDMNVVGPRPEQPEIFAGLRQEINGYTERQRVLPGITGWAQVCRPYDIDIENVRGKVQYDLDYIARRSVGEDVRIMLRTIPTIVLQRGAW